MTGALVIKMRRVGERRTWFLPRSRPEYEIVITNGSIELFNGRSTVPSAVLVEHGKVHTTDSYDWIASADSAYARHAASWITGSGGHDAR